MEQFYMPVRIVSGQDCLKKNCGLFASFGRRALVVTGKSSARNGALEDIEYAFNMNGQAYVLYDAVPPNPTVQCVEEGGAAGARARGGIHSGDRRRLADGRGKGDRHGGAAAGGREHLFARHRRRRSADGTYPHDGGHGQRG